MKYKRFILLISAIMVVLRVAACGYDYDEKDALDWTNMYRIIDEPQLESHNFSKENIRLWKAEMGYSSHDSLVARVVYKYTVEQVEQLYKASKEKSGTDISWANDFARVLVNRAPDGESHELKFLLVAKRCEEACCERAISPWYYPVKGDAVETELNEIVEICRQSMTQNYDSYYTHRYLLQELRALNALGYYEEILRRWHELKSEIYNKSFYRECELMAARAYYNMELNDEAIEIFVRYGDVGSIVDIVGESDAVIETIYNVDPQSDVINRELQSLLTANGNGYDSYKCKFDRDRLLALAQRIIAENKVKDVAVWYYAAAAMCDAKGRYNEAMEYIRQGQKRCVNKSMYNYFAVLRMLVDAKSSPYNAAYEQRLLADLKCVDAAITVNLDNNAIAGIRKIESLLSWIYDYSGNSYYWNDAMRHILYKYVIPNAQKSGRQKRALQLANYASYRLMGLLNENTIIDFDVVWGVSSGICQLWNAYDFHNLAYYEVDDVEAACVEDFVKGLEHPRDAMDRFIANRGKTDMNYWNELLATKFIRELNYAKAVEYLEKVPASYQYTLNVYREADYMRRDPFEPILGKRGRYIGDDADYKLRFAQEMVSLEKTFNGNYEPNRRAAAMMRYAFGMRNSYCYCWALTRYQHSDFVDYKNTDEVLDKSRKLIDRALSMFTDKEMAARYHYQLNEYKYVIDHYRNTETAGYIIRHCDIWADYALHRNDGSR